MKNKILIADQQAQMRHLLGAVFTQQGYKVKTAQNGKDALETIYDNELDIIVLNHELPVINGVQLINWLEDNEIYTPIVIIGSPHDAIEQRTKRFSDRKSTRLNFSHVAISYAVFCLKQK